MLEQIGVFVAAFCALTVLWMLLKRAVGREPVRLTKEQEEVLEGARILLADDSATIQKVVELTFMDTSVDLICAADGKSATDLLKKEKFNVVIADVHMPEVNGYEVCEYAKTLNPETPVLLLIGTFEPFDEDQYKSCAADEYLKKPFDSAELIRIVAGFLQRQKRESGVP